MMLEDERLLTEKEEFYRRRLLGQLKDSSSLMMESLEDGEALAQGAMISFEHAKKTAEQIGNQKLSKLVEKTGAFLASITVGE